jgi:hypothetical protein
MLSPNAHELIGFLSKLKLFAGNVLTGNAISITSPSKI